ncbi:MAG: extracellular solute-binding protein [Rhodomicrobium sp.]|nr:extracellular solute-binding protein [Rhodomicrobium sp.]
MRIQLCAIAILLAIAATAAGMAEARAAEVNLYSYREPQRIAPLLRAFHAATGIRVKVTFAGKDLIERIAAEGEHSPADVLLTNEFGLLLDARALGLTQAFKSPVVEANVPASYRDPEGHWFGLTRHARLFVVSATRVSADTVTYEELAEPRWKGKICMRSGKHPYNTTLIASMLAHHGSRKAEAWLRGVKANLARPPSGGDRDQIRAVIEGVCDVAVVNSYYAANFIFIDRNLREQKHAPIRLLFSNSADRGTHVAISGAALMKHSRNKESGIKLIELLTSELGQRMYSAVDDEYPVSEAVAPPALMASWPTLRADTVPLHKLSELRMEAQRLVDAIAFDDGPNRAASRMR